MLGGGFPLQSLTELCGAPGSGKTQLCNANYLENLYEVYNDMKVFCYLAVTNLVELEQVHFVTDAVFPNADGRSPHGFTKN
nr:unnamed protein product [Timema californicum]